jgi:hypothetical protein
MLDFYQEKGARKVMWITLGEVLKQNGWEENDAGRGVA